MFIKDVMSDWSLIESATKESHTWRQLTDARAVSGAAIEVKICEVFNASSDTHKLLTQKMVESLKGHFDFNLSKFASSYDSLKRLTKIDFGPLSAADLFLFKKETPTSLVLIDAASLKTSSTFKGKSVPVYLHNDSSGDIHSCLKSPSDNKETIGNIIMIITRDSDCKVYHFDKPVRHLREDLEMTETNKHGDDYYGIAQRTLFKSTNRHSISGRKATSFNRGVQIQSKSTLKEGPFDCFEIMRERGVFSRLCEGTIKKSSVIPEILERMSL
jgi:hypothetical protein|tara:strand:- start:3499 stop:4314 length:816 start_codon:yes stop_codon:yes gene_type:complete